jgi:malate dehydrogenase (oxaloacetate-decarboxylating)(NADP+)
MTHLRAIEDPLQKFCLLSFLKESDSELFFAVAAAHVTEIMPLVYTPVVGKACQEYSRLYVPRPGLYVTLRDAGSVATLLSNWREKDVRAICFTDGQRILGLGDLGTNGMGIPVGKLALYTVCAGMPPQYTLPVTIDVGTDTKSLLDDPLYIGMRQPRDRSPAYDALIDEFISAAMDTYASVALLCMQPACHMSGGVCRFGRTVLLQWEDFGNENAFREWGSCVSVAVHVGVSCSSRQACWSVTKTSAVRSMTTSRAQPA